MEVIVSETPQLAAATVVGTALSSSREVPTLVLLSGGSWLSVYDELPAEVLASNLTFMMVDERYSLDDKVNNFAQLHATKFWERAEARGGDFIDTSVALGETLEEYGARFAAALAAWQTAHPAGRIIALLGIGADGHTAGIFPDTPAAQLSLAEDTATLILPEVAAPDCARVTVTSNFLIRRVEQSIFYVVGSNKCARLKSILNQTSYAPTLPGSLIKVLPAVTLITDCSVS